MRTQSENIEGQQPITGYALQQQQKINSKIGEQFQQYIFQFLLISLSRSNKTMRSRQPKDSGNSRKVNFALTPGRETSHESSPASFFSRKYFTTNII